NGVYKYGASAFPEQTYAASNYWVDVVFMPDHSVAAAPAVISASPASGASGVPVTTVLSAIFDQAVRSSSM
ncbi:Ig-like domain-containing protein, partial [Cryobacterium cryoconiti]|uniref:Ig-like domain-containing protein n=1 Tax=Cryobacterium cryoconiti TaxID=1259239 RepID=UPI001A7E184B